MRLNNSSDMLPLLAAAKNNYKAVADGALADNGGLERLEVNTLLSDETIDAHRTTVWETFVHLVKGYIGAGCLSLPWAVSQLGMAGGIFAIFAMSYWSSYNCWIVVKLKRHIERANQVDDKAASENASSVTTNTNVTYPTVGGFMYGDKFESYVSACVCTQQLAICTVFFSFIGENLLAVLVWLQVQGLSSHLAVMTLVLPLILSLSFIPDLKGLSPVMTAGTVMLMATFVFLGIVVVKEWKVRPDESPAFNAPTAPLALCAILYSYEGINLILPIESAMAEPKHFKMTFVASMLTVCIILAIVAAVCVEAFGNVTNGSVTAFLVETYSDDPKLTWFLMIANTAVSLSVLLTYPLQLFPALELLGPWFSRTFKITAAGPIAVDDEDDDDLSAFEPLPPLPEHDVASLDSLPEHQYEAMELTEDKGEDDAQSFRSSSAISAVTSVFPVMTMPGDSAQMRAALVLFTYLVAVVVPNVQALISLAGALAGSSTALLIPPILEWAFLRHLEEGSKLNSWFLGRYWAGKLKCLVLLIMGLIFMAIGTYASILDIVKIYRGVESAR